MNISVIIPVYNAAKLLEKSVNSALQCKEVKEILLIEDGSKDNSLDVCTMLIKKDNRIKLFQHPDNGNHGAGASRNLGIEKATQEYIAFLDADDFYLGNRFEHEVSIFNENPQVDGVFNAIGTFFYSEIAKENFNQKFNLKNNLSTVNYHAEGIDVFQNLINIETKFGTFFSLIALTLKREKLLKSKLKFNENLRLHQDTDFIIKLSYFLYLKSGKIDKAVSIRGVHENNRITSIERYSEKYFNNQMMLKKSLYDWSKKEQIKSEITAQFRREYLAFYLQSQPIWKKLIAIITDYKLLKTRFRFLYFYKN